jgi:uncharacterized membrane protein YfbV (UPF0208 family)
VVSTRFAFVLLPSLAVAFLTTHLFYQRDLKPQARQKLTRLALANTILANFGELLGWSSGPARDPSPG